MALVACVAYPLLSWAVPTVGPAWGMYTGTTLYRLHIVAFELDGTSVEVPASALASHATAATGAMLLGAEDWKHGFPYTLASSLDRLADLVCTDARVSRAEIVLEVREYDATRSRITRASRRCPAAR